MTTQNLRDAARATLQTSSELLTYYSLPTLEAAGLVKLSRLPFSLRVLLENALRNIDGYLVTEEDVHMVANWDPKSPPKREFPFMPSRVLMQDFTGVPAVVDLAAMRSAIARQGGDPGKVNPSVPVDLVIDHSVQVDSFGSGSAFQQNVDREFERNMERYAFLRWAQDSFENFRVVPPGTGIVHQVNLEYLASVVATREVNGETQAFPDTVVGLDSHTTMINGLSVLGWGVGGIEAEAVLLAQPYYMQLPEVVGFKLTGAMREGVTATDLVLTVTQILRKHGVVNKFVEFFGPGLSQLPLPDKATLANMAPEYGATCGFFPIDDITIEFLRATGRDAAVVERVEQYAKAQGLFRTDDTPDPEYTDVLALDMGEVEPSLAGPRRPQDKTTLVALSDSFVGTFTDRVGDGRKRADVEIDGQQVAVEDGSIVIAAITSCTNTSNPSVMVGAGLLAKSAVEKGLTRKPWVKTSIAPGSQVVTEYMEAAGLTPYMEALDFHLVGYGCTTCIGNSGPLAGNLSQTIRDNDLVAAAVLSGNRNFEGRVHPEVKANYLASPMLVVAFALAGTVNIDLTNDALGIGSDGQPVYLRDVWPSQKEIRDTIAGTLTPEMFRRRYADVFTGPEQWRTMSVPEGELYDWDPESTYIEEVPFFQDMAAEPGDLQDITGARVLVMLGDSVTTDHISPAGSIPAPRPAGQYLVGRGVQQRDFNTYGARRGHHDVMIRGTFGNVRLRNKLTPEKEGDWTLHLPDGEETSIFEAAQQYQADGIPTIAIGGKEYGSGSSRDWAAKGPALLGIKAAIVESFERIHRSNLIGMGVLPLQFKDGQNAESLGLTGKETYSITGVAGDLKPASDVQVTARSDDGSEKAFTATVRIDTPVEVEYYRNGGVLQTVLRRILKEG
ncbi:MAG: aconitate hydratase [Chloroflexi bacterium]|jgi:aconitate hydratase|nr:MAG: aconitate hydratase [Chloroflexota bacterium]